jgi:hypothetical protein
VKTQIGLVLVQSPFGLSPPLDFSQAQFLISLRHFSDIKGPV